MGNCNFMRLICKGSYFKRETSYALDNMSVALEFVVDLVDDMGAPVFHAYFTSEGE